MKTIIRLTPFKNPSGKTVFRLAGYDANGNRIRKNFQDGIKAATELADIQLRATDGTNRPNVSAMDLALAEKAELNNLSDLDKDSLLALVRVFMKRTDAGQTASTASAVTVATAYKEFLDAKTKKNLRPRSMSELRSRLNRLKEKFGGRAVATIRREELEPFIFKTGQSGRTTNGNRQVLHNFFRWCRRKHYLHENPVADIERAQVEDAEPEIFTLDEVTDLLHAAYAVKEKLLVPYFLLGFFAGLRPKELARITWGHINLEQKVIRLTGDVAKKRQRRTVELSDNLVEWLHDFKDKSIVGPNWRKDMDKVRRLAGFKSSWPDKRDKNLKPWPEDGIRHTALSYHFARDNDEKSTAYWAGNSPDTLHKFYKGLVTPKEVMAYWGLTQQALSKPPSAPATTATQSQEQVLLAL